VGKVGVHCEKKELLNVIVFSVTRPRMIPWAVLPSAYYLDGVCLRRREN
jgi:hypothetical protein